MSPLPSPGPPAFRAACGSRALRLGHHGRAGGGSAVLSECGAGGRGLRVGVGACVCGWVHTYARGHGVCVEALPHASAVDMFELLCLHPLSAVPLAQCFWSCAWILRRYLPPSLCPYNVLTCCSYSVECNAIHLP